MLTVKCNALYNNIDYLKGNFLDNKGYKAFKTSYQK